MPTFATARRLDSLGRVVLPSDLRKVLCLRPGDLLAVEVNGDHLELRKALDQCVLCAAQDDLLDFRDKLVCRVCIDTLRA